MKILMALLGTAGIAALVSALVSVLTTERGIAAVNVIQERKNWRDKIREIALEVHKALVAPDVATLNELRARFSLLVNPHDGMDQEIVQLIQEGNADRANEFTQRLALLLKHDWERAKREASLWRRLWERPPARIRFEDYTPGREHGYRVWRFSNR
jgi:Flp pilus assembly protein TadD